VRGPLNREPHDWQNRAKKAGCPQLQRGQVETEGGGRRAVFTIAEKAARLVHTCSAFPDWAAAKPREGPEGQTP
jgi:hypothetical protein